MFTFKFHSIISRAITIGSSLFLCSGCSAFLVLKTIIPDKATLLKEEEEKERIEMMVRLTVYWKNGSGVDKWTKAGKTSTGSALISGKTVAVDPKVIPYFTEIRVKEIDRTFIAVDTGSGVVKRRASKRDGSGYPVVDVFFKHKKDAMEFVANNPKHVKIEFYKDKDKEKL